MTTGSPSSSQADPRRPRADDDAKHAADHADARSRSVSRGERDDDVWAAAFRKARNRADMEGEPATDHDGSVDQVDAENGCRSRQGVQNDDADPSGRDGIESSAINGAQQEVDERQVQRDDVGPSGPEGNDVAVIDSVHEGDDRSAETDPLDLSCLLSGSLESESSNCDVNSEIDEDQSDEDQSDEDQSDEDQSDEDQSDEDQSDEDQSDEDQSDEDQSDEDQSDEDQSDEDQSDEDQSDEDQSDEDQSDEDRPEASTDRNEVDEDQCESVDDPLGADIVAKAVSVDPVRRDTCLNSLVSASAYKKDDAEDDDSLLVKRRRWCRRAICAVMLSSVLVLSVYIGMVGIQLGKLASSQFFMVDMAIDSLCSDRITVNFDGVLFNPSTASLGISDVAFAVSTDGFSKPFLKGAIPLPQFTTSRQSSSVLGPGDNLVNIAMRLNVLNRAAVSELLARSVAKTPTHVKVSFTAMLSLQPLFLLPITFPFSGNEIVVLNEPTGAPRPNPPQVTSIAITADSPKQGLLATIAWEMEALLPGVRLSVPLPEINAKILSQGKVVALATNRAATLSPKKGNFTSTVQIPTQQSTSELLRTQALIRSIASGADDLSIQVTGVPSPGQPPSCMLQDVIDQMPPVTFQLALTSPMSSNVGNGFSSSGAVLHSVSSPSNSRPKPSPPSNGLLGDVSVDIVNVRRAADNPFGIVLNVETSVMVQWTMDVQLTQIVFDLMVAGTSLMAVITILPVSVIVVESGRRVPVKLTIDIELADEQLAVSLLHRSMANGFHDLPQLTICGRSGSNFLSRLFTQVSIPIPIPPRGVRPSIPNIDYSIVVDASCDLNVFVTAPAFKGAAAKASSQSTSSLPPITVIVPGGQVDVADGHNRMACVEWDAFTFDSSFRHSAFQARLVVSRYHDAFHLGSFINDVLHTGVLPSVHISGAVRNAQWHPFAVDARVNLFAVSLPPCPVQSLIATVPSHSQSLVELVDLLAVDVNDDVVAVRALCRLNVGPHFRIENVPEVVVSVFERVGLGRRLGTVELLSVTQSSSLVFVTVRLTVSREVFSLPYIPAIEVRNRQDGHCWLPRAFSRVTYNHPQWDLPAHPTRIGSDLVIDVTSNRQVVCVRVAKTMSAVTLPCAIRVALQPMAVLVYDDKRRRFMEVGTLCLQPMLITSGREYHVKLDIEIGTTSFTRERRLTDILARVLLEGGHSRIAIHLVPQHNAASDLTPFYSWVNLTKIPMTSRFKFEIVRIDPIGNVDSDGMTDLEIPCFMRGSLCPYDRTGLVTSFGLILQIGLKITTAVVSSPFVLTFPECSFTVDYGTFPVLDITVQPMSLTLPTMFSNGGLDFFFNVTIESMDTEMLGAAYDGLMQSSQRRAVIRAHPSAGPYANFVSRIFSGVSFEVPIDRSKPSTGNSSGFVFEYALVSTNSYSAGFKMVTKLPFTAPFDISWGNVRIALHWKGEAFADATTDLTLAKGALLHRDIYARVFGENVDPMKQCDVQDFINPKMCVANSVLQLALAAAQGNTSLPLVVDLQFTNMFGIHQRWWMDLTVFEAIPTISRKSTASKSYGLLRALSVNTNKLFSSLRNSLSKRFVEVPMYAKIYNPLNFVLACNRIDGKLFFTDLDGVHSGYIPFVRLPPTPEVKLASVKEQNHWELHPLTVTTIDDLTFNVDRHQVIETGLRLFDEKILHNRLCIDVDKGVLDIEIRAPNSEPLLFTQILTLHKFESQGHEDCKLAPECHPKMAFVPGFDTAHFADPSILVNGDGAKIARNGSAVDITTGRHQFTSVFWRQPVRIDDSFSFTMTFRMQGFAILSNGIAFVVQGEGPEAFSRNKWGLGLGRSSELAIVFSNQFSTAIYVMRDGVEIARTHETIVAYDDGKFHTARIDYTHQSERVDVYIDDKHVLVANFNTALLKLARNRAWIGVTASTEWLTYSIQTIELMSLSRPVLHVPMFVLVEKGLITGSTLHPSRFTLEARDSCGFPRYSGEPVTFCVALRPQRDDGDCSIDAASSCLIDLTDAIADNHDGTYTVEFTPDRDGMFDVLVRTADAATPGRWIRLGDIQIEPVFD
ncbi:C2 domain-containing protein [Plasmodiophora brassicae]